MPTERKTFGKPRRNGTMINAGSAPGARGTRSGVGHAESGRAGLEMMREMGYAHPAAIGEFINPR